MTIQEAQQLRYGAQKVEVKVYPDWIPVEHCLPDKQGVYLTYDIYNDVNVSYFLINEGRFTDIDAEYWMPLPPNPSTT